MSSNRRIYCIYKHTSPSGKAYIGQTSNLRKRNIAHRGKGNLCLAFAKAIEKYGWGAFAHEILEDKLTLEEANEREEYLILKHGTLAPNGYNLKNGGLNRTYSEESKQRISASQKRAIANSPKRTASLETRRKRSETLKGHTLSQETRQKIGDANRGKRRSAEERLRLSASIRGRTHSTETKRKIGDAQVGYKNHMFGKVGANNPVAKKYVITFPDGGEEIIHGLSNFCKNNGLTQSNMSSVATGRLMHHKGFKCKRFNEEEEV